MKYESVIFDLDGTILDTLDDLADAVNFALGEHGFPLRSIDEVRQFVGNGMKKLIERSCPSGTGEDVREKVLATFTGFYKQHNTDKTKPYAGVLEMLENLRDDGVKTAVVSNKDDYAVQDLCKKYFPKMFDASVGARQEIAKKPAPDSVFEVMKNLSCDAASTVYVGDSEVDIATAENANIPCILVSWGFRSEKELRASGAKLIAHDTEELLNCLRGSESQDSK